MTPQQLHSFLKEAIPAGEPVLIDGPPGIGKTDITKSVCEELGYDMITSYPGFEDPTEPGGFLWPSEDRSHAAKILIGAAHQACKAENDTVWFLDEFGQGQPATQAAYMPWILARHDGNGHSLPDNVSHVMATNRRTDKSASHAIIEPIKGRVTIVHLEPDVESWCDGWAKNNGINPLVISFLKYRQNLFCDFQPSADLTSSPMPRNWAAVSKLWGMNLDSPVKRQALQGRVGEGPAMEFISFVRLYEGGVTAEMVLNNPEEAGIPVEPHLLYAVVCTLGSGAKPAHAKALCTYSKRLHGKGFSEYATLLMMDSLRSAPSIGSTKAFMDVKNSELGNFILGV